MDDIFIDDRRQISAKAVNRSNEAQKGRRKRKLRYYLVDLIIKTLIAAALISINFTLFAEAGSYNLFTSAQQLNTEALIIYAAIGITTFLLMWLVSFSVILQNLLTSAVAGVFLLAIFNQFAVFDKSSFLGTAFAQFSSQGTPLLNTSSHLIISGIFAFIFLIFISLIRRSTQAYFAGILLIILGGLLSEAYFDPGARSFRTAYENPAENKNKAGEGNNFIFIALPNLTSYQNLRDFITPVKDPKAKNLYNEKVQTALNAMLGFYTQHNFILYPNAFIEDGNPFLNLTASYNLTAPQTNAAQYTQDDVLLKSYWDFNRVVSPTIYLKNNKLFDTFRKNKYSLNVYQSRGIESCQINNRMAVNKCVVKNNIPVDVTAVGFTTGQKSALLLGEWLESTGLVSNVNPLFEGLSLVSNSFTPLNFETSKLYVLNSHKIFDLLARDISASQGNNAYFATVELPSDLYLYDGFCKQKPLSKWVSLDNRPWFKNNSDLLKKEAYAEQISCLYGQLENFMQTLSNSGQLSRTVIVLQGISTPSSLTFNRNADFYNQLKGGKQITLAIFDPLKKAPEINNLICPAPVLFKSYLYKKATCRNFDKMNLADNTKQEMLKRFADEKITEAEVRRALPAFINWYQKWADANKTGNNLANLVIPAEVEKPAEPETKPQEVKEAPEPQAVDDADKTEAPVKPLPAPETPADESVVKLSTKVIDNQTGQDVIPPFIEDTPKPTVPSTAE